MWWIAALLALQANDQIGIPAPPPARRFVVDEAAVLDSAERRAIDSITTARAKVGMPLYVLTIRSLAAHDTTDMTFEAFSHAVFDKWRATRPGADHATLLLVSVEDHRARIEPGPAWGREHDPALQRVMEDALEPSISRNSLDQGLVAAANEITWVLVPPAVSPWMREGLIGAGTVIAGVLVLGFIRRRRARAPVVAPAPAAMPRPMAAVDPNLRMSQRMQALTEARKQSEKAASSIAWLETGEMPKYENENPPSAEPPKPSPTDDD